MPRLLAALLVAVVALIVAPAATARADVATLEEAVRRFRDGDDARAVPLLERLHAEDPGDLETTLLLAIAYQRTGRAAEAAPLFRAAAASPEPETRDSARTFQALATAARRDDDAPLSLYLLVRPEWDSNVALASGALIDDGGGAADGALLLLGSIEACLGGTHRLCLGDTASLRRLLHRTDYDSLENLAGLSYRFRGLSVGYGLELARIGGALFSLGHLADARLRAPLGGGVALVAEYRFALRDYRPAEVAPLSGPSHAALLGARVGSRRLALLVAATPLREDARDRAFSAWGAGGRLEARLRPADWLTATLAGALTERWFDGGREDRRLALEGELAVELSARVGLVAGATFWRNDSTDDLYRATRTTVHAGVDVSLDGP